MILLSFNNDTKIDRKLSRQATDRFCGARVDTRPTDYRLHQLISDTHIVMRLHK